MFSSSGYEYVNLEEIPNHPAMQAAQNSPQDSIDHLIEMIERMLRGIYEFASQYKKTEKDDVLGKIAWNFIDSVNDLVKLTLDQEDRNKKYLLTGTSSCPLNENLDVATHAVYHLSLIRNWLLDWQLKLKQTTERVESKHHKDTDLHKSLRELVDKTTTIAFPSIPADCACTDKERAPFTYEQVEEIGIWGENLFNTIAVQNLALQNAHNEFLRTIPSAPDAKEVEDDLRDNFRQNFRLSNITKPSKNKSTVLSEPLLENRSAGPAKQDMTLFRQPPKTVKEPEKKGFLKRIFGSCYC